jgi:endogenous inhibitor of DNA gyrase (YacG/DUF329 family)
MTSRSKKADRNRGSRCPICDKPTNPEFRPFCSKRCADVDLGRWLTGRYVVPGRDGEAEEVPSAPAASDGED